jgi:hypothetical protein
LLAPGRVIEWSCVYLLKFPIPVERRMHLPGVVFILKSYHLPVFRASTSRTTSSRLETTSTPRRSSALARAAPSLHSPCRRISLASKPAKTAPWKSLFVLAKVPYTATDLKATRKIQDKRAYAFNSSPTMITPCPVSWPHDRSAASKIMASGFDASTSHDSVGG